MKRFLLACLFFAMPLSAHGSALASSNHHASLFPITIVDDHGNHIRITRMPRRIVSLDPRDTETLFALDLQSRVVGDGGKFDEGAAGIVNAAGKPRDFRFPTEWPSKWGRNYPIRSLQLTHVEGGCCGTPFNLETIESLQPDLVIGPYSATEVPTFQKMRDLGLKVLILDPSTVKGILHDLQIVGRATGAEKQAATVTATMESELHSLDNRLAGVHTRPRVYYEIDASDPAEPYTAGPGTFIDEAIARAKGRNVADSVTSCAGTLCYPQFSLESLVQLDPQVIVLGDAAYGTKPTDVQARPGWQTIAAVQTGKIYPFDDSLISRAGPRIVVGLTQLARLIHPQVFKKG